jgi:glycosyltransferase involved in cell wall biosynthesis
MIKKKVFFLIRQFGLGGTERRMLDLAASLKDNYDIQIFPITGYDKIHNVSGAVLSTNNRRSYLSKLLFLRKELKKHKPDLVHAFDADSGIYAALALKTLRLKGTKLISGMGAEFIASKLTRQLLKWPFFQPDLFICNSVAGRSFIFSYYTGKINVDVIPNGLDGSRFAGKAEMPFWAASGRPVIGYIGKMDQYKRGERLAEIAGLFEGHPQKPLFVVMGGGEHMENCKKEVESSPFLKENLLLLDVVDNAAQYIQFFSIGVLCSDSEGFPNVILEYMACGIPVVTTGVGDIPFIVDNGKAGLLIEKYDPQKFADAIHMLLTDPSRGQMMITAAKNRFEKLFTIDIMKKRYLEVYDRYTKETICAE